MFRKKYSSGGSGNIFSIVVPDFAALFVSRLKYRVSADWRYKEFYTNKRKVEAMQLYYLSGVLALSILKIR